MAAPVVRRSAWSPRAESLEFHGTGFEYYRDKSMNANTWTNNRVRACPLRTTTITTLGLTWVVQSISQANSIQTAASSFFFVDEEWQHQLVPTGQQQVTVPTAAERTGDFSQSVDQNGNPVVIKDPATGQPFPGNLIPTARLYAPTVALLNLLPLPNAASSSAPDLQLHIAGFYATSETRRQCTGRL